MRSMLVKACHEVSPEETCHEAANLATGLALAQTHRPRLAMLDVVLPDGDGLSLVPPLRNLLPAVKIIVVSGSTDDYTIHRVQQLAVDGFVSKVHDGVSVMVQAMTQVLRGSPYHSPSLFRQLENMRTQPDAFTKILSAREQQMLQLIGQGLNDKSIAAQSGLSPNTVRNHRQRIMAKLDIHTTSALIHYALEKGFARARLNDGG